MLIVTDSRCGEAYAFNSLEDFRNTMMECGWTEEEFENFMNDEPDVHEAEFVMDTADHGAVYVYETPWNMGSGIYQTRYIYYRIWKDGTVRYLDTLEEPASREERDEWK